ncbi:MAG: bifunctional metallophosphatase/5'-nucleotidase [Kiritimatiellae bacterium]|nr:bifunctional metallophosphatase/5'-nucleotidase [Kiritimatiellia bacterium]MDW8458634.1 bifunctional UDP-sugar hydrolase/5'-nucleotidase [Verrucomicrobiota bacterium]
MPLGFRTISSRLRSGALALLLAIASVAVAAARPVRVTILHTTDLHGAIRPTEDYSGRKNVGGLLRCATLIRQIRAESANTLLIDCGDLFQGSAESWLDRGRIMVRAIDVLDYDAWVIGNHEFDWGLEALKSLHDLSAVPMLAANIVPRKGRAHPLPKVRPFLIREVDGVRIAIVGLTTPGMPLWFTPDMLGDCLFERSVDSLRRVMPVVREQQPDIWVLAVHQGIKPDADDHANEIRAIAREFPEFDIILGAHTHRAVPEAWPNPKTLYTQAGYFGIWLGRVDLEYETVERRIVRKSARLYDVDENIPPDAELERVFADEIRRAEDFLQRPVGQAVAPIDWKPDATGRSPIQALLSRAIAEASGAQIVLHGALSQHSLPEGEIRMADVWRIVPFENRIALMHLTPAEILEILRENAVQQGSMSFLGIWGANYEWANSDDGTPIPVRLVLSDGTFPHPRKRFAVAVNSYVVASGGGRFRRLREIAERPESRMRLLDVDTRRAVLDYINKHSPLDPQRLMEAK